MFIDLRGAFQDLHNQWAEQKDKLEEVEAKYALIQGEMKFLKTKTVKYVICTRAVEQDFQDTIEQQSHELDNLRTEKEKKDLLEDLVKTKDEEIELLKEYKRRKELEESQMRLHGGSSNYNMPLRKTGQAA